MLFPAVIKASAIAISTALSFQIIHILRVLDSEMANCKIKKVLQWICLFLAGKVGFHALGLGLIRKNTIENGNGIMIQSKFVLGNRNWDPLQDPHSWLH